MNCDNLGLEESFQGTYFGHAMSKACEYDITNEKVFTRLHEMSIKYMQMNFQKCITWLKKSRKGCQEWTRACINMRLSPWKLNKLVRTR